VKIVEHQEVTYIEKDSNNIKVITSDETIYNGSHLLIADIAGVIQSNKNIKVDAFLKTSNKRIFAIGDVTGERQFTHTAEYHAGIIIKSAAFGLKAKEKKISYTLDDLFRS
ncbi:FAD-dependent oxidoreductase, partial [Amylibacter sp.]|nr:FAD-dependent oxidoreductase [Amylibacter sp.]